MPFAAPAPAPPLSAESYRSGTFRQQIFFEISICDPFGVCVDGMILRPNLAAAKFRHRAENADFFPTSSFAVGYRIRPRIQQLPLAGHYHQLFLCRR